jgi:tetratricopeptide (TPR) repeat protein
MLLLGFALAEKRGAAADGPDLARRIRSRLGPSKRTIAAVTMAGALVLPAASLASSDYQVRQGSLRGRTQIVQSAADRLNPGLADLYLVAGDAHAFQARFEGGGPAAMAARDRAFRRALKLHPGDPVAYLYWGQALQLTGEYARSLTLFQTAESLVPGWPLALKCQATSLAEMGGVDRAAKILRAVLADHPADADAAQLLRRLSPPK